MAGTELLSDTRHRRSRRGNMAVVAALSAIPLALAASYGVELAGISSDRATLQAAVDSAALAGASELVIMTRGEPGIQETARNHAQAQLTGLPATTTVSIDAAVNRPAGQVTVTGVKYRPAMFAALGREPVRIEVSATAEVSQSAPLCILQSKQGRGLLGLHVLDRASVRAPTCLIHANRDIAVLPAANITAGTVQAVGRILGPVRGNAGAMAIADPFASMDLAPPTPCSGPLTNEMVRGNQIRSVRPGVHCTHFFVGGNATLQLEPGEHWFMGNIQFRGNARLRGDDVVLIFGRNERFDFGDRADIELTARRTGRFAGFLIATGRNNTQTFSITSDRVRELLGTIYIPEAHLMIRTSGNVAQDSAWSVIVAETITLYGDPVLVINTGYAGSGVPVPNGVGPSAAETRLTR